VSITDITSTLLILAILLFMAEIAVRRLNIPIDRLWTGVDNTVKEGTRTAKSVINSAGLRIGAFHTGNPGNKKQKDDVEVRHSKNNVEEKKTPMDSHISILLEKKRKREGNKS